MFAGCTSLTKVAYLPASALKRQCYGSMFANCTSLTKAPTLPALALNYYCYASMFKGCTGLTEAPELPATTMWAYCYGGMFMGCTNLTKAPALPTVDLTEKSCYAEMFSGCTSLSEIEVSFEKWSEVYSTYNWVDNVAPAGTFICPKGLRIECGISGVPEGWVVKQVADGDTTVVPVVLNYLAFTAEKDSSSFKVSCVFENQYPDVQYSLDEGKSWINLKYGSSVTLVKSGDRALIRGYNPNGINTAKFVMTGRIAASGSIMSLIDGLGMSLVIPSVRCFDQLFYKCTSLTAAPELPATKLAISCYKSMFNGCVNLTKAPELPAKTLQTSCYYDMFSGCTGLSEIGVFFEDWIEGDGTTDWVRDVASTGTFICPKALALEYGDSSIPNGWRVKFVEDTTIVKIDYLTFLAEEDSSSFGIIHENGNNPNVMYSLDDGESWLVMEPDMPILLGKKGDKALLKGYNPEGFSSNRLYSHFSMSGKIAASGSVMSLVDGFGNESAIPNEGCFTQLFFECSALTQAPELPAVDLKDFCYYYMFQGCTGLIKTPELPAVVLAKHCYAGMFDGCISLAQAPSLPSATLAEGCYKSMFSGCTSLTLAPELPALSLQNGCYYNMFAGCESLAQTPELPAMELAEYCYGSMFFNCPNLVQASALPASALAYGCYESMFQECTSLAQAPELPATELQESCYSYMFSGCASLKKAPELPAPALKIMCYEGMFRGCTTMSEIKVSFKDWMIDGASSNLTDIWVHNVAPTGTFVCPKTLALEYGVDRIPEGWTVKYIDDTVAAEPNYLTFTAEEDGSTFGIVNKDNNPDVQYSLDGGKTWTALAAGDTITLAHKGDKALLKGNNPQGFSKGYNKYLSFTMTGKIAASGSVMSLIDGVGLSTEVPGNFCFYKLFQGCTNLTQAPELPATTLANNCYYSMFSGCTSLTQAPELPATTLAISCYEYMFYGCTSLTKAPELPATTLVVTCYLSMFSDCVSLTSADLSFEQYVGERSCCNDMFRGCTNLSKIKVSFEEWGDGNLENPRWVENVAPTGTFYCPKALPLEYGVSRIPEGWTVKYIEDMANYLTFTAEEDGSSFGIVNNEGNNPDVQYSLDGGETWTALAAGDTITLAHKGDKALLRGNNPEGFSKSWEQYSTFKMTGKVAASGSVMSLIDGVGISTEVPGNYCFYKLFQGCTSLTQAPKLPATTLAEACYFGMFADCTSLTQAPELPATTLPTTSNVENGCYSLMFLGCTSLTQAPELPATTLAEGCYADMFYGCTSLTQAPKLPATTLSDFCYFEMFSGCTSLTQAPELPATTLEEDCYRGMFNGCKSLSEINVSFATWSDYYRSTAEWVEDVAPTGTFICPKALALEYGISRIPEGWTVKYIEGEGSGVNTTLANNITVWSDDLTIYVRGAKGEVSIYDLSGKRVAVSYSADEERALCVPSKGVYVVRTNNGTSDVLVR